MAVSNFGIRVFSTLWKKTILAFVIQL